MNARRIGGIEVHIRELAARLAECDCRAVLCFPESPSPVVQSYLSSPNITWEVLPDAGENSLRVIWHLLRILRKYRPIVLHLQFTPLLSPAAWVARLNGVRKIFFTDHHSRPENFVFAPPAWKRAVSRLLQLPVTTAVAVSDHNRRIIASTGAYPPSRLRRIHNGVDLARPCGVTPGAAFRECYGIPQDRLLITQISQIKPEKGVDDILHAAQLALTQYSALHFVFVGDGDYLNDYARRTRELGIEAHVTWTGLIMDPVAEGVFAAADILCLPSRWQEAFGLVLAEAMSCEKPVVATRVGGIPEVVEDGVTGFLVTPGDAVALAEKLILLARDPALRERLGRAGRERAAARFDVRTNTRELLEVYGAF